MKFVFGAFPNFIADAHCKLEPTLGASAQVRILSTLNRELLKPSASVALHRHSNALVDVLPPEADSSISLLSQSEKPDVTYQVIPFSLMLVGSLHTPFFGRSESCLVWSFFAG